MSAPSQRHSMYICYKLETTTLQCNSIWIIFFPVFKLDSMCHTCWIGVSWSNFQSIRDNGKLKYPGLHLAWEHAGSMGSLPSGTAFWSWDYCKGLSFPHCRWHMLQPINMETTRWSKVTPQWSFWLRREGRLPFNLVLCSETELHHGALEQIVPSWYKWLQIMSGNFWPTWCLIFGPKISSKEEHAIVLSQDPWTTKNTTSHNWSHSLYCATFFAAAAVMQTSRGRLIP